MPQSFCRNFAVLGLALCVCAAAAASSFGRWPWALAVLVGGSWLFLNLFMLVSLMEMTLDPKGRKKDRVLIYSILKFPVLYVAGFFVLKSRFFPVGGVLTGLTLVLAAFVASWMRAGVASNRQVGKAGAA
ncbi:MAG TPA: hypothetical protein VL404_05090 [Candidatus Eisenbacteria bacterium]|nr:hypothetical protein [Candidatus Eisenbacteria bacterium]